MEPGEAASTAVAVLARRTVGVARDHPKITGTWAVGLVLVALATGFTVTQEAAARYEPASKPMYRFRLAHGVLRLVETSVEAHGR